MPHPDGSPETVSLSRGSSQAAAERRAAFDLDLEGVARLARLDVTEKERDRLRGEMRSILRYVNRLQELDTDGIEATFQMVARTNIMRTDEERPCLPTAHVLANAPQEENGFFRMPRILEEL